MPVCLGALGAGGVIEVIFLGVFALTGEIRIHLFDPSGDVVERTVKDFAHEGAGELHVLETCYLMRDVDVVLAFPRRRVVSEPEEVLACGLSLCGFDCRSALGHHLADGAGKREMKELRRGLLDE